MICWLNPFSGLSGDMLLGALVELGAPVEAIRDAVASTGLTGWSFDVERIDAGGILATRAVVGVDDAAAGGHGHRHAGELLAMIERAKPAEAATVAARAVRSIAEVEARLHGADPADVHLHEVGGHDTVVDTVGVAAAVCALGITGVVCAPPVLGSGTVQAAHGLLPVPAPATIALLEGAPAVGAPVPAELVTPTGAALLRALDATFGPMPPMIVGRVGYGAGTRRLEDRPNVLPAVLGSPLGATRPRVVLETNVDDVTGELLAHLIARLLDAGADDAWATPIVMKKGRPAHTVSVLAAPERAMALEAILLSETGSLGVRRSFVDRSELARDEVVVDVAAHAIRIKRGPHGAKPEHDDVAALAATLGIPLRDAARRALGALDDLDALGALNALGAHPGRQAPHASDGAAGPS